MGNDWQPPEGHPVSKKQATELIAGDYGDVLRSILKVHCVPIYWYTQSKQRATILHNGTLTLVTTSTKILGITAAHVIRCYEQDRSNVAVKLQIGNHVYSSIDLIDISDAVDIATIAIRECDLKKIGVEMDLAPMSIWPPQMPMEGGGIMLGGYPGNLRLHPGPFDVDFGFFYALCITRRVTDEQITWVPDRENMIKTKIPLEPNQDLGGISGGPIISCLETKNYIQYFRLAGIISQANSDLENVVAKRADFIMDDGSILKR